MPEEEKKSKKVHPEVRKRRRKRVLFGSFGFTFFFSLALLVFLYFYGDSLLENLIISSVENRSEGMYRVEIGEINTNFLDKGFEVTGFHLIPDRAVYRLRKSKGEVKTGLYDIFIPRAKMSGLELLSAYYENSFIIHTLRFDNLDLKLLDIPVFKSEKEYKEGYDDIRPIIMDLVEYFKVEDLIINEGVFDIFLDEGDKVENFTASKISLRLKDFQIDRSSADGRQKFLYSEGAKITFKDYKLYLNDEIHIIEANEIGLNTLDSVVFARGFSMRPGQKSISELKQSNSSYFSVFFPEILLEGADIIHAYENDTFDIRKLLVLRPKINYINQVPLSQRIKSSKTLRNQIDIYPLIDGYLNEVSIKNFKLEEGNFKYLEPLEAVPENISIKGIDVILEDLNVDSTAYLDKRRIMYSSNMELDFNSFEMFLRDTVHILEASSLYISSKDEVLEAKNLSIRPSPKFDLESKKDRLNILIPSIKFSGIDLFKMYLSGELDARSLVVDEPDARISIKKKHIKRDESEKKTPGDIYALFSRYLNTAKIELVQISDGAIDFDQEIKEKNEEIIAENITLRLYDFLLDSSSFVRGQEFLFSENIDFELKDYDFILPNEINEITVGLMSFSSKKRQVLIDDVRMKALGKDTIRNRLIRRKKSSYLEFEIPAIRMEGADILRALRDQNILVDEITLESPKIHSYSFNDLEKSHVIPPTTREIKEIILKAIPFISVNEVHLKNGLIENYSFKEDSTHLNYSNRFKLDLNKFDISSDSLIDEKGMFFSDSIRLLVERQKLLIEGIKHEITTDSIIYSFPDESIVFNGFLFQPYGDSSISESKSQIHLRSPQAIFNGVDLDKLYNEQILDVAGGSFDSIWLEIAQNKFQEMPDSIENTPQEFAMPEIVKQMHLEHLHFNYGAFNLMDSSGESLVSGSFRGEILDTEISDKTVGSNSETLPFRKLNFLFPDLQVQLNNQYHNLSVDSIHVNLEEGSIKTNRLRIHVDSTLLDSVRLNKKPYFLSEMDSLVITGIDLENYYLNNDLSVNSIQFWHPDIDFYHYPKKSSGDQIDLKGLDLFPKIQPFANQVKVDEIFMANGDIRRFNLELDSNQLRASLERVYLDFINVLIDSLSGETEQFLFSEDIILRVKDYEKMLPNEMYMLVFDELGVSTGSSQIYADGTHIKPLFDEYEFSRELGYQSDRIDAKFNRIEINQVDLEKLYRENELRAGELLIDSFHIDDFRDKRVAMKEGIRPPMFHEIIRNIPIPFSLDSIQIEKGYAQYREFAPDGVQPGMVFFNDLNGKIYSISNDSNYFKIAPNTYLFAIGRLMDEGDIIMSATFNLLDTNNTFSVRGNMGEMSMSAVNPMLEDVAYVTIRKGRARSIDFQFNADDDMARGDLNFRYNKFKIFLINKKTGEPEGLDEGIASWFANTFLINRNNPHLGFFKEGEVLFRRDKRKSIVNYVWKSIYSGIKTSIGAQTQKKLRKIAEKQLKAEEKRNSKD